MPPALWGDGDHDFHIIRSRCTVVDSPMMASIQQYMAELFRPFAEHISERVDKLHKSVDMLNGDFRETNQIARVALEKHVPQTMVNHDIRSVSEKVDQLHKIVDIVKADFRETNQIARVALEKHFPQITVNHDIRSELAETKLQVSDLQKQLLGTQAHADMLKQCHDERAETKLQASDLRKQLLDTKGHINMLKHFNDEYVETKLQVSELRRQLLDTEIHVDRLKHSNDEHAETKLQVSELRRQLLDREAHFDMLRHNNDEHAETKLQLSDLQKRLLDTEAHFDMLKHSHEEHAETKLQVSDLQKRLLDTEAHVDMLKHCYDEHAETTLQVSELQRQLLDMEAHFDRQKHSNDEHADTKLQVSELRRRLLDTEAHFDMLEQSNDEHVETKLQVSDLQKQLLDTAAHVDMLKHIHDEHAETKLQVSDLQKQLLNKEAHVDMHIHGEHAETKIQVSELQKQLLDIEAHIDMLKHIHEEHVETKLQVSNLQKQLLDTNADTLKHNHDTKTTLAELSLSLQETRLDLQNLDTAQQGTTHMVSGTKQFANDLQKEFKLSQRQLDDMHDKHTDQLTRVNTRLMDMSKMLTETINRVNHLKSNIADKSTGQKLLEAEMSKMRTGLDDKLGQLSGDLTSMQEALQKHSEVLPAHEKRVLRLEINSAQLQYEVRHLHEQVGTQPATETPQSQTPEDANLPQVTKIRKNRPHSTGGDGSSLAGAVGTVMNLGLKARVEKCSKRVEAHDQDIATANRNLQVAQEDLQRKTQRIEHLETEFKSLSMSCSETKQALELTQEWWKGLSHGFRETSRLVNAGQDPFPIRPSSDPFPTRPSSVNAGLPARPSSDPFPTILRSITPTTQSCGSRPVSARPRSARTTKERHPREVRPGSARTAKEHLPREAKEKQRHVASWGGR